MKLPTQLNGSQLLITLNFIHKCIDVDIQAALPEEIPGYDNMTYDELLEILNIEDQSSEEWKIKYDDVTIASFWLRKSDYTRILKDLEGSEYVKEDAIYQFFVFGKSLMIAQFIKVNVKGERKTIEELEVEIKEAVDKEDYELATNLKKRIENRKKRRKKL